MKLNKHILLIVLVALGLLLPALAPVGDLNPAFTAQAMGSKETPKQAHEAFMERLQPRDSLLIADQIRYGARIYRLEDGTRLTPEFRGTLSDSLMTVRDWHIDTLKAWTPKEGPSRSDIEISTILTSFEAGTFDLPGITVERWFKDGIVDSLTFEGREIQYCTMPVDTATFQVHELKAQIDYPVTFVETLPWIGGALGGVALIALAVWLIRRYLHRRDEKILQREPAHIVALRKLDAYRGDKYWTEDKQKQFYSGVTDALREYIAARYGVGAMEMTTRELFRALKGVELDLTLRTGLQHLFETADFVKFAKMTLPREENATVVPFAVQFVTATYEQQLQEEAPADKADKSDKSDKAEKEGKA